MEALINIGIFVVLLACGYFAGTYAEKKHFKSIEERERKLLHVPAVTFRTVGNAPEEIKDARLVSGEVVISVDYFKKFIAGLRDIVGGRVTSYESLMDRARREAILRMKEAAGSAHYILNVRLETASINKGQKGQVGGVEVIAYGTAVTLRS